jgi:hypothetical protein
MSGRKNKGYFVSDTEYYCSYCNQVKNITDFPKDKSKPNGFKTKCKECHYKYLNQLKANNIDEFRKYRREYYHKNKDK